MSLGSSEFNSLSLEAVQRLKEDSAACFNDTFFSKLASMDQIFAGGESIFKLAFISNYYA